jgi:thioredoxin 1
MTKTPRELTADDWEEAVLDQEKPVVVEFWHEQCPWCLKLAPIYEELAAEYAGRAELMKLNVLADHENQHLALGYGVAGTPTMKVFCGGREVGELVGYMEKPELKEELDRIVDQSDRCLRQSSPLRADIEKKAS